MRQLQARRVSTCGIRVLAGFGLRVEKSGTKTFIVRYRADGGGRTAPRRFATIGRFGPLTVDEARRQARVLLGAVATGEDPAGERQARRREMTITALVDLYEAEGCFVQRGLRQGEPMKARTKAYTVARLRHHVVPLLGHKRVTEVGPGAATLARDGSPPITRTTFPTCRAHYPGGSSGCACRLLPRSHGLPQMAGGSASALSLSRPAQASLTLRPVRLLSRLKRPLSRGSNPSGYPAEPLVSFQINRQLSGWNLPPLMIRAFGAHCHARTYALNLCRA